jgi:hypothetical protein
MTALPRRAAPALLAFLVTAAAPVASAPRGPYPRTPRAVVEAYCKADFDGMQTDSDTWPWFARYATWPDAPGWDTFTIVAGYTVSPAGPSKARVVYEVLGVLAGEEARAEPGPEEVVYTLARRGRRWKVDAPQLRPHVSPEVAMRLLDGLERNEFVAPDLEKVRASRDLVRRMAAARSGS